MYGLDVFLQVVDVVVALVLMFSFYGLTKNKSKNQKMEKEGLKEEKEPWSWFPPKSYEFKVGSSLGTEGAEELEKMKALMVAVADKQKKDYTWRVLKNRLAEATYWRRWVFWKEGEGEEGENKVNGLRLAQFILLIVVIFAIFCFLMVNTIWRPSFYLTFICLSLIALFIILRFVAYFLIDRGVIERYSGMHFYQYVFAFGIEFTLFDVLERKLRNLVRKSLGLHVVLVWLFTVLSLSFLIGLISVFWGIIHKMSLIQFFADQLIFHVMPFSLGISTTGLFLPLLTSLNKKENEEENKKTPVEQTLGQQVVTRDMMNMWIGFFVVVIWLFHPELKEFGHNKAFKMEYLLIIVSFIFVLGTLRN
jgi:hypothetical protein